MRTKGFMEGIELCEYEVIEIVGARVIQRELMMNLVSFRTFATPHSLDFSPSQAYTPQLEDILRVVRYLL